MKDRGDQTGSVRVERANERLAILAEAERLAHVGSWHWDLRTGGVEWSDGCFRILGHEPRSFVPTEDAFYKAIHPDDLPRLLEVQKQNHERKRATDHDLRVVWPSGEVRHVRLSGVERLNEAGELVGFLGTLLDLTELREQHAVLERAQRQVIQGQKMEALGRLAAGVAHDFNNVLSVVLALAEQIQYTGYDPRLIEEIAATAESGAALTRQLLLLAKGTSQAHVPLQLEAVVNGSVAMLKRVLGKHVTVECSADTDVPPMLGDEGKLQQVLLNLAVNARDAMPTGGTLRFSVTNAQAEDGAPRVCLRVSDTGLGIDESVIDHVFEPFFTTKAQDVGTGLGLSTVYAIVTEHGGTISVESRPSHGTTFVLRFPVASATQHASSA